MENKTCRISIRIDEETKLKLLLLAHKNGFMKPKRKRRKIVNKQYGLSKLILDLIDNFLAENMDPKILTRTDRFNIRNLSAQFRYLNNNINQIAKKLHEGNDIQDYKAILYTNYKDLYAKIKKIQVGLSEVLCK
ncbi:MAG TPA: hypothetical protein PKY81_09205 [bacterium]|nr:hypothetical protein [bacterium]